MPQQYGLSNGRGGFEFDGRMANELCGTGRGSQENDAVVVMTTMAVSRRLAAPTDRNGLLHMMQAGRMSMYALVSSL